MPTLVLPQTPNAQTPIVDRLTGIATYDHALFLQQLYNLGGYISFLDNEIKFIKQRINELQSELNTTQAGAGLSQTGNYLVDGTANYIDDANTIHNATQILDTTLYTTTVGAGLNADGTYLSYPSGHYISGASSIHNATQLLDTSLYLESLGVRIINLSGSASLSVINQSVLCNAASGNMSVFLPNASASYVSGRSREIAITKIDTSLNSVTIYGTGGALVANSSSQILNSDNDVINLVTNGQNWYLGS